MSDKDYARNRYVDVEIIRRFSFEPVLINLASEDWRDWKFVKENIISADATAMHPAARAVIGRYPLQRDLNVIYGFSRVHGIRLSDRTRVPPDTVVLMRLRNVGESTIYYEPRIRFRSSIRVRKAPGKQSSEGETKEWRRISFKDKPENQVACFAMKHEKSK